MKMLAAALAFASATLATPAMASFIVDTGTPAPSNTRYVLGPSQSLAGIFTLANATTISSVEGFIFGRGNNGTVSIYVGGSFFSGGPPIFSSSFSTVGPLDSWQGVYGRNWLLTPGTYWAAFSSDGGDAMLGTAPSPLSNYAFTSSGNWFQFPGLNLGIRIADSTAGAVPEPATWAMLLFGFAGAGAMMRRRRAVRTNILA
jgi:PEP-CTERM motif